MAYFSYRGIDFHYQVFGLGEPIIFLHGIGNDLYQPKIHLMNLPGHLIMPDIRGHGLSGHNNDPMSYGLLAEDLRLFVRHLGLKVGTIFRALPFLLPGQTAGTFDHAGYSRSWLVGSQ